MEINVNDVLTQAQRCFVQTAIILLNGMSKDELDKIISIKYPDQETEFIKKHATVIAVTYPNKEEYINVYWMGGGLFRMF